MGKNYQLKARIVLRFGTQRQFAQRLNLDPAVVSGVVTGKRPISEEARGRWAKLLGCEAGDIFGGEGQ